MAFHLETPEEIKEKKWRKNLKYNTNQGSQVSCSLIVVKKCSSSVGHLYFTLPPDLNRGNFQIPEEAWAPGHRRQKEKAKSFG